MAIEEVETGDEKFLTRADAANWWPCTRANIAYHIKEGNLSLFDVGGVDMIFVPELKSLRAEMEIRSPSRYAKTGG